MAIFLILSIAFNTLFAASYKIAARKDCNLQIVNIWMYIGSLATLIVYWLLKRSLPMNREALILGVIAGLLAYFATMTFFLHIRKGQLSASWTVISLSVAFPVLASILYWHEMPTLRQKIGMVLIVIALLLFGRHETTNGGKGK
jgi:uncharacterized membrane protein